MTATRTLVVPAEQTAAVARILHRSIATDTAEVRRLTMLGTAYHDRPAGSNVDRELIEARARLGAAEDLLAQLAR